MAKKRPLMSYVSEIVTGTTREEFLNKHGEPVLVQAYKRETSSQNVEPKDATARFSMSSSSVINPDDLEVLLIGHYGSHLARGQTIYIGRQDDMDVVIDDPRVSRIHAQIIKRGGMYAIKDCSTNGTFVNGKKLPKGKSKVLEDECTISFGPKVTYELYFPESLWQYVQLRIGILKHSK